MMCSLVPSLLHQNGSCHSEDGLGNCINFLGAVMSESQFHNHMISLLRVNIVVAYSYMVLDVCHPCDVVQGPGSGTQLIVARSTSASISVNAVWSLLCNIIISDDPD